MLERSLEDSVRHGTPMASTLDRPEVRDKTSGDQAQQNILASKRPPQKENAAQDNKGRLANLWPLGNVESFRQWVGMGPFTFDEDFGSAMF